MQRGDFVAFDPPYPETDQTGLYTPLYATEKLHENLLDIVQRMEDAGIEYVMQYGLYNPELDKFAIRNATNQRKNRFRVFGGPNCIFGTWLDQIYFSSQLSIPHGVQGKILEASEVLDGQKLSPEEALESYKLLSGQK